MATSSQAIPIIIEDKKYCTPCKKTGQVTAQYYCTDCEAYYCESCFEFHTRIPMLAKHIVLKGKDIDVWADLPYKCHTHDKTYEFFCGKHETLCCHICVSLQHRYFFCFFICFYLTRVLLLMLHLEMTVFHWSTVFSFSFHICL